MTDAELKLLTQYVFFSSLRGFSSNDTQPTLQNKLHEHELNFAAGIDLLERFQSNWVDINTQSLDNAKKAEVCC